MKSEVLTVVQCPQCKVSIEVLKHREVVEPAVPAVVDVKYAVRLSSQKKLLDEKAV